MLENKFWSLLAKKLSGEATPEELSELEQLMRLHPEWLYSAQNIHDLWQANLADDKSEGEDAFLHHLMRMEQKGVDTSPWKEPVEEVPVRRQPVRKWMYWAAAACVAGIITLVFIVGFPTKVPESLRANESEVSTRKGSKSKLILPDGSVIWLNAGSRITYGKGFGTKDRKVSLEGEAFFDVVKMPELPFVIHTRSVEVKVLGTAFNVKSYPGEPVTETTLIRGKVEVMIKKRPGELFVLQPNEKLVVKNDVVVNGKESKQDTKAPLVALTRLTYVPADSTIVETSWVENKLVFQDESFSEIARKMERWYNVEIEFGSSNLEEVRLTGTFTNETIEQALQALQITENFQFVINQNKVTISNKR